MDGLLHKIRRRCWLTRAAALLVSSALIAQPVALHLARASALGALLGVSRAWAQAPSFEDYARQGQDEAEALLEGFELTTDPNALRWTDQQGNPQTGETEDFFPDAHGVDDRNALEEALSHGANADSAIDALATDTADRLDTEDSAQGQAYQALRDSIDQRGTVMGTMGMSAHPNPRHEAAFAGIRQTNESILSGDDPIFGEVFNGCTEVPITESQQQSLGRVSDIRTCDRIVSPAEGACAVEHHLAVESQAANVTLAAFGGPVNTFEIDLKTGTFQPVVPSDGAAFDGNVPQLDFAAVCDGASAYELVEVFDWSGANLPGEYDDTACYQITQAPTCENDLVGQLQIVDDCGNIDEGDRNEGGDDAGPESSGDATDFLDFIVKPLKANPNRQYGGRWVMRYNKVVQDAWSPQRCIDAAVNVTSNICPGSVSCSEPPDALGCVELNGVRVCEGDPLFALLPDAPIPGVHKLCREVSVAADCRLYGGTLCVLNHEGVEVCTDITGLAPGEERNECEAYENDASCKRTSTDCLELSDGRQDCNWRTEVWDCGFDIEPTVVSTQTICDGEIRCMGESCISQQHEVNTGFAEAAATMHAVEFTGRDMSCPGRQPSLEEIIATGQLPATEQPTEQNPQGGSAECELKVFEGEHHTCKKALSGYVNCCEQPVEASIEGFIFEMAGNAGTMLNLIMITYTVYLVLDALARLIYACELKEVQLEAKRDLKSCTYVGSYCAEDTLFGCIEKHESYCCYNSPLARIVAEQTKGVEGAYDDEEDPDCSGFTPEELAELNWEEIDLSEWVAILVDSGAIPSGAEAVDYDYSPVVDAVGQQDDQPGGLEGAYESINQDLWRQQQQ